MIRHVPSFKLKTKYLYLNNRSTISAPEFTVCFSIGKDSIRSTNVWHQLHQEVELSSDMFAECLLLAIAVCVNLALLGGTIKRIPFLFLPWMLVYGFEVMGGWAITLAFLLLPGNSNSYVLLRPHAGSSISFGPHILVCWIFECLQWNMPKSKLFNNSFDVYSFFVY